MGKGGGKRGIPYLVGRTCCLKDGPASACVECLVASNDGLVDGVGRVIANDINIVNDGDIGG